MTDCTATPYPKRKKNKLVENAEAVFSAFAFFSNMVRKKEK
jgi:hypothetical protein